MTPNNNLNILPFYETLEEQNHRKTYAFGSIYNLVCENSKLLPFQVRRVYAGGATINFLQLVNIDTDEVANIKDEAEAAGLNSKFFASEGYDLIINPSLMIFPNFRMRQGQYYLRLNDTAGNIWYSEIFTVVDDLSSYLKLSYWDNENFVFENGHIDYSEPYKNYVYLPTEIGKPEYPFEEEAQKRDGHIFIEKQISEKQYKFNFIAPEFLCDALRIVRMHDNIQVLSKGKTYDVETMIIAPKWQDQGDLASVNVEFECATVVKKIGKSVAVSGSSGDFNNDFNNDFNI